MPSADATLGRFFSRGLRHRHEAGESPAGLRPGLRMMQALLAVAVIGTALAPAPARADMIASQMAVNMHTVTSTAMQAAAHAQNADLNFRLGAEAVAVARQVAEQGVSGPRDPAFHLDRERAEAFVARRVAERDARDAADIGMRRVLDSRQMQAHAQGLDGWSEPGFREDPAVTAAYAEAQARDGWQVLAGIAGGIALPLAGVAALDEIGRRRRKAADEAPKPS